MMMLRSGQRARQLLALPTIFRCGASGTVAFCLVTAGHSAQAETRVFVETSTKVESSENPYLLVGTDTQSVAVSATVAPTMIISDGTTEFRLNGKIGYTEFLRRYESTESFGVNGNVSQRINERLSFDAGLSFDSGVIGAGDLQTIPQNDPTIVTPPVAPGDIALNSLRKRRNALAGTLGVSFRATARESWQIGGNFAFSRFPSGLANTEYDQSGVSVGYNRTLSDRTSIGVNMSVARADYKRTQFGDSLTVSPQATVSTQLGLRWSLSGSAGVSISTSRNLTGKVTQTSLSGSANVCRTGDGDQFCGYISRAVEPTLAGDVRPQTSIGGSYRRQLAEFTSVSGNVGLTRSSSSGIATRRSTEFARALIMFTQRFSDRFTANISTGYNDSFGDLVQRRANYSASIGLSYRLGDRR
jgi:hypothetical protein